MTSRIAITLLTLLLLTSAAQANEKAKALFIKGSTAYNTGDFKAALASFKEALKLDPKRLSIIFNVAQCHRQLGHSKKAIFFYKLYLSYWEQ